MASKDRKSISAGVTDLMGKGTSGFTATDPGAPRARKTVSPVTTRERGKTAVRKLTVDVPETLHNQYEDLYLELRRSYRKLKRVDYAPLVIQFGLDRKKIEDALTTAT